MFCTSSWLEGSGRRVKKNPAESGIKSFRHLEFTRLNHTTDFIAQLVDIYSPGVFVEIDSGTLSHVFCLMHFLALGKIVDLDGKTCFVGFRKVKRYEGGSRVRIETNHRLCLSAGALLALGKMSGGNDKD